MNIEPYEEVTVPPASDPLVKQIRAEYDRIYLDQYGRSDGKGLYSSTDWRRIEYAAQLIPPDVRTVLDVGVGPGALLNYLGMCNRFKRVVGIDKREYSRFISLTENAEYQLMNIRRMKFPDNHFDAVVCLEVLEHLDDATFNAGLSELRRVAKNHLIMSVPFEEPEPLPSYHLQRFDRARLVEIFPNAAVTLLHRPKRRGWPWAIIAESDTSLTAS